MNYIKYIVLSIIILVGVFSFITGKIPVMVGCIQALAIFFGALIYDARNNA